MNGSTQMNDMEHCEHELDPSLTRTGRYENNIYLINLSFYFVIDFVVVLLMILNVKHHSICQI